MGRLRVDRPIRQRILRAALVVVTLCIAVGIVRWATRVGIARSGNRQVSNDVAETTRARPNVLIIILDALRADFVGAYSRRWSGEISFTPNLDRLASKGARFSAAIAPSSWTRPSVAGILTGFRPMRHANWQGTAKEFGLRDGAGRPLAHSLSESFDTLAEVLRGEGYVTACFPPSDRGQYHRLSGFSQGFQFYEGSYSDSPLVRSDETFRALVEWFEEERPNESPFFAFVHTLGAHEPYLTPAPYDVKYSGAFKQWKSAVPTEGENRRYLLGGETTRDFYLERYAGLVSQSYQTALETVIRGEQTVEQAFGEADDAIQACLDENM